MKTENKMEKSTSQHMGLKSWILLLILSVLWGGSFFFIGVAVKSLPPLTIVSLRLGFASVLLWVLLLVKGVQILEMIKHWRIFLMLGIFNNVLPFILIVWAQGHISSGVASILNATSPIFTVVVAGVFLSDEPFTKNKIMGVVCGFIGVVILLSGGFQQWHLVDSQLLAEVAVLTAALSYSIASVFGRRISRLKIAPMQAATGQITVSFLLLIPFTQYFEQPLSLANPELSIWFSVLGLAFLSTVLAYVLYFKILALAGALNLMLVTFLIPVSAIFLGVTFLSETLSHQHIVGMLIIGMGLLFIDGRWVKLKSSKKRY